MTKLTRVDIEEDLIHNLLKEFGLEGDDILLHYVRVFMRERSDDWDAFIEHVEVLCGEGVDLVAFVDAVKSAQSIVDGFAEEEKRQRMLSAQAPPQPVVSSKEDARPPVPMVQDPEIKKQILQQYSLRPEPQRYGAAPVLSTIEYLQGGGAKAGKKQKRYRNDCVVTEKGEKYVP